MKFIGLNIKRLNRVSYVLTLLSSMFLFVSVGLLLSAVVTSIFGIYDPANPDSPHPLGLLPFMALWFVYFFIITSQRFHDMNMTGWYTPLVLIPFIGFVFAILLLFIPGSSDENKYGKKSGKVLVMGVGK